MEKRKIKSKNVGVVTKIGNEKVFIEKLDGKIVKVDYDDFAYDPVKGDRVRITKDEDGSRIIRKVKQNPNKTNRSKVTPRQVPVNEQPVRYQTSSPYDNYYSKKKKSIFKRKGFWITFIFLCFVIYALENDDSSPKLVPTDGSNAPSAEANEDNSNDEKTIFAIGETASIDGYEIRVNSVEYSSGGEWMKPSEGNEYVIVNITITNNTSDKQSFNPLDYTLNVDGVSSTMGFTLTDVVETLSSGDLDVGASVTGNVVGEAPPGTKLKLRYEGNFFRPQHEVDFELR